MNGLTISEMAAELGVSMKVIEKRLQRSNIKPISKEAIYSFEALEKIRDTPGKGRPRKPK